MYRGTGGDSYLLGCYVEQKGTASSTTGQRRDGSTAGSHPEPQNWGLLPHGGQTRDHKRSLPLTCCNAQFASQKASKPHQTAELRNYFPYHNQWHSRVARTWNTCLWKEGKLYLNSRKTPEEKFYFQDQKSSSDFYKLLFLSRASETLTGPFKNPYTWCIFRQIFLWLQDEPVPHCCKIVSMETNPLVSRSPEQF